MRLAPPLAGYLHGSRAICGGDVPEYLIVQNLWDRMAKVASEHGLSWHSRQARYRDPTMSTRHLINEDGAPFDDQELEKLVGELESLSAEERKVLRDGNAEAIANHAAGQMLIVAGPGTGKSTLFKKRILLWLKQDPAARILALSFVRKLIADLHADIQNDKALTEDQKKEVDVFTLHKYARSVVEQNRGKREWKFVPHFRIIGQSWTAVVWDDVLLMCGQKDHKRFSWEAFEKQLHDDQFDETAEWKALKKSYFVLCQFFNAAGFSDLILRAKVALAENPDLNQHHFFIIDEYQDFNTSEERLLEQITTATKGKLVVGDDDQVLYEALKSGKASLIRAIYNDKKVVNAMLPFCGRCDVHIVRAADHFIKQTPDPDCIKKIFLPMSGDGSSIKVQSVACATPTTAVDYIRKFVEDHSKEIEQRKTDLVEGKSKDAYLLVLSPSRAVNFYRTNGANEELFELIKRYSGEWREYSDDYYMVLNYYSLANYPSNNFTFRKVLHYEGVSEEGLLVFLKTCIAGSKPFSALSDAPIKDALAKAAAVRDIIDSKVSIEETIERLSKCIHIADAKQLQADFEKDDINKARIAAMEHQEEEDAELEEIEVKQMSAVELMTIVGAKGLSADHVIIIGFDNVNMGWITRNAFYVAMTRARKTLHLVTALKAGGAAGPHQYIDGLPDANLQFSKYAKGDRALKLLPGRAAFLKYLRSLGTKGRQGIIRI
jgi:superfamily I DNA/RNA helicase